MWECWGSIYSGRRLVGRWVMSRSDMMVLLYVAFWLDNIIWCVFFANFIFCLLAEFLPFLEELFVNPLCSFFWLFTLWIILSTDLQIKHISKGLFCMVFNKSDQKTGFENNFKDRYLNFQIKKFSKYSVIGYNIFFLKKN